MRQIGALVLRPVAGKWKNGGAPRPPLRRELAELGLEIAETSGFGALSFASLAEHAGVDEAQVRTQFHTLYEVVFAEARGQLEWLSATLADRAPGQELTTALRQASIEYIESHLDRGEYHRQRIVVVENDPQLLAWQRQFDALAIERIIEAIVGRGDDPVRRVRAEMRAASGIHGLRAILKEWAFSHGETDPVSLYLATEGGSHLVSVATGARVDTIDLRRATASASA